MKAYQRFVLECAAAAALVAPAGAQVAESRATLTGARGDSGKCTIEVVVDGSADVEIRGDRGVLRTLTGMPATWRRFQCTTPMPLSPGEFRFAGIDGRGNQQLVQDPRNGRGVAIVRIQDPRGGAEGYTFDLEWRGEEVSRGPGGPPGRGEGREFWRAGGYATADAISSCLLAVEQRGQRDGYRNLRFGAIRADDRPGRADWIVGSARAQQGLGGRLLDFDFACQSNLETGSIRAVELNAR